LRIVAALALLLLAALAVRHHAPFLAGTNIADAAPTDASFSVTNVGLSAYRIDGVNNPTLNLVRGQTYTFNVSAIGHPFYIKVLRSIGAKDTYDDGVTGQAVQSGVLTFVVPGNAPSQLFYQCGVHGVMGGTLNITDPVSAPGARIPGVIWLGPATPNPTHEGAVFQMGLPQPARIEFAIFDARGRRIRQLANGTLPAGEHLLRWDGRDAAGRSVPSGTYFYRLRVEDKRFGGRFTLTR